MSVNPENHAEWTQAKEASPSRKPYSDEELFDLRVAYSPRHHPVSGKSVVIWTLLDMLEEQRGWKP